MTGARVLVVDDEPQMLRSLRLTLSGNGYDAVTAESGEAAVAEVARRAPDVVLLDLMLPGMDGLEVVRQLRRRTSAPIIVLSAQGDESVKVQALDLGADDYLTKPFGAGELLARLRVALRHAAGAPHSTRLAFAALAIDVDRRRVTLHDQDVTLTPKEYEVLRYLAVNAGRVLTHAGILRAVWGPEYGGETQYLRNVVLSLRRKLEDDPARPALIVTEPGVGYRFHTAADS